MSETTLPDRGSPVKSELSPSTGGEFNMLPVWCGIFLVCTESKSC